VKKEETLRRNRAVAKEWSQKAIAGNGGPQLEDFACQERLGTKNVRIAGSGENKTHESQTHGGQTRDARRRRYGRIRKRVEATKNRERVSGQSWGGCPGHAETQRKRTSDWKKKILGEAGGGNKKGPPDQLTVLWHRQELDGLENIEISWGGNQCRKLVAKVRPEGQKNFVNNKRR